jgi:hypothetical protein
VARAYRGDSRRGPELVDTARAFAETALLSARLFRDVPVARGSRWIEIITVVLREGVIGQDELSHARSPCSTITSPR